MKTEHSDVTEGSWKSSDWVMIGYILLLLVPSWLYLGYAVLAPARADVRETVQIDTSFEVGEAAFIHQPGEGAIGGRVFVKMWTGEEVPGCGKPVLLIPGTAFSRERVLQLYGRANGPGVRRHDAHAVKLETPDPKYWQYMRQADCDGAGRFRFEGVADGEYFVIGSVAWRGPQGGTAVSLMQPVAVEDGRPIELVLTPGGRT